MRRGRRWGSSSSRNTLARTSSAAAEHFPAGHRGRQTQPGRPPCQGGKPPCVPRVSHALRFQSDSASSSSSSSVSSEPSGRSASWGSVTVRDLWKRGLMSCSLSGTASSSSTSPWGKQRAQHTGDLSPAQPRPHHLCLTLSRMMSISEYFMPFTRMGINLQERGCSRNRAGRSSGSGPGRAQAVHSHVDQPTSSHRNEMTSFLAPQKSS